MPAGTAEAVPFNDRVAFNDDRAGGTFDFSGLKSGTYVINLECVDAEEDSPTYFAIAPFSEVKVQKTVIGEAPADASYTIELTCETFTYFDSDNNPVAGPERVYTFEFGPTGGTDYVYLLDDYSTDDLPPLETNCEAVETESGGADEVHYEGAQFQVLDTSITSEEMLLNIGGGNVEITNVFHASNIDDPEVPDTDDPVLEPGPTVAKPQAESGSTPDPQKDAAAKPVTAAPKFTG